MTKTIVLIHGAWLDSKCWDDFRSFFETAGYRVVAPEWPRMEETAMGIREIAAHHERIVRAIVMAEQERPILIGHSYGGLVVQMLLDRDLGRCGIAIDSVPPKGIFTWYPSTILYILPVLWSCLFRKKAALSFANFARSFANGLSPSIQKELYEKYIRPEFGKIFWQSALSPFNHVAAINAKNISCQPLLLVAGSRDRVIPSHMTQAIASLYGNFRENPAAKTDFKEFDRNHLIITSPGWEEIAQFCLHWIQSVENATFQG